MPKPEVKTHTVFYSKKLGRSFRTNSASSADQGIRINPDGTWVFVDDRDREIRHWDLKLEVGDVVIGYPSGMSYEVVEVDPTRWGPYRLSYGDNLDDWFDHLVERWEKVEPKPAHRFGVGDLVHSERAGGTFRIHEIDDDRRVCRMTDFQGRIMPFDLDYVQGHFKPFGAKATTANPFGGSGQ